MRANHRSEWRNFIALESKDYMRKALPRDRGRKSVIPLEHPVLPEDLEW